MRPASYFREQAQRARRLAQNTPDGEVAELLSRVATDYDDIAEDLEAGLIDIRHPELLPQNNR